MVEIFFLLQSRDSAYNLMDCEVFCRRKGCLSGHPSLSASIKHKF